MDNYTFNGVCDCIVRYNAQRFNSIEDHSLRSYRAMIHKISGEILFQANTSNFLRPRDWKAIRLEWDLHCYQVFDSHSQRQFRCDTLQPLAYRVLIASLYAFLLERHHLLKEAWHPVTREGAEALLESQEVGTFLFRQDEYAALLEGEFQGHCITLSYVEEEGKVVDATLVEKKGRWSLFDGDPELRGDSFSTLGGLLESLPQKLLYAYPAESWYEKKAS